MNLLPRFGRPEDLTPQTAWIFLTANLLMPGVGSITAGRRIGYAQLALTLLAFALTLVFGLRFVSWSIANWAEIHDPEADPLTVLAAMWHRLRWPLLAIALFVISELWALGTSLSLRRDARRHEFASAPPKLR